jgi:hypothetical protein
MHFLKALRIPSTQRFLFKFLNTFPSSRSLERSKMFAAITLLVLQLLAFTRAVLVTENWNITDITTHYMGIESGVPGNFWPENARFASTIKFNIFRWFNTTEADWAAPYVNMSSIPPSYNIRCGYQWPEAKWPSDPTFDWIDCGEEQEELGFRFRFLKRAYRGEWGFILEVIRGSVM